MPPQHSQVSVIKLVGQEPQCSFRMEIGETEPVRRRRVDAHKQWQEMLTDLYNQVADPFPVCGGVAGVWVRQVPGDLLASQTEVRAIVAQAYGGGIWQHNQIVSDYSRFPELYDGIDLTAACNLVGQKHVLVFCFTISPTRETRADEELAIECV